MPTAPLLAAPACLSLTKVMVAGVEHRVQRVRDVLLNLECLGHVRREVEEVLAQDHRDALPWGAAGGGQGSGLPSGPEVGSPCTHGGQRPRDSPSASPALSAPPLSHLLGLRVPRSAQPSCHRGTRARSPPRPQAFWEMAPMPSAVWGSVPRPRRQRSGFLGFAEDGRPVSSGGDPGLEGGIPAEPVSSKGPSLPASPSGGSKSLSHALSLLPSVRPRLVASALGSQVPHQACPSRLLRESGRGACSPPPAPEPLSAFLARLRGPISRPAERLPR